MTQKDHKTENNKVSNPTDKSNRKAKTQKIKHHQVNEKITNPTKNSSGFRKYFSAEAGFNISWSSVFAGVVTFFSILVLLSLIGSAIGFGLVEPTSGDPFSGVGIGVLIWTVITMVLSFMAGGFVAGIASRRVGVLHGFLTWATSLILMLIMLTMVTTTAITSVGNLFGSAFSMVGDGVSSVTTVITDTVETSIESASEKLGEVNTDELQVQIKDVLEDTETPELQPEYLENQLKEAGDEIAQAGKDVLLNPDDAEEIIADLTASLQEKAQVIGDAVDRDAIAKSVSANTDLTEAEAEKATENIYNELQTASQQTQESINEASKYIEESKQKINQMVEEARVQAEAAADATAKASVWAFTGLTLALILTSLSGLWGSNFVEEHDEETM